MQEFKIIPYKLERDKANIALEEIGNININLILTGKAGADSLDEYYKDVVKVIDYFDPKDSNEEVNPIISSGYRLSSYIYHVYTNNMIYKIVPIYKNIDLTY